VCRRTWASRNPILLGLLLAAGLCPFRPASAAIGHTAVQNMLADAEEKAQAGQFSDAVTVLQRVLQIEPENSEAWEWLGFCRLAMGDRDGAIEAYAAHLKLAPESEQGWAAMNRLFFDFENRPFPPSLNPDIVPVIPVTMELGRILTPGADGTDSQERQFAYTASVVFPEPMAYPENMRIPSSASQTGVNPTTITDPKRRGLYNRVSYGYILDPDTGRLELKLALHYPSETLTGPGIDGSRIADAAVDNLLRLWWLGRDILGRVPSPDDGPLNVWLTSSGEAGGEQWRNNLYLYEFGRKRKPAEWLREIAHEWGHLLLPGIDGFTNPEAWANGVMGETLFLKWLAQSAEREGPEAVDALWPGKVDLAEHFASHNDTLLNTFLTQGPNSTLLVDRGRQGMDYIVGLTLFADAVHGSAFVRRLFDTLAGDHPADLVRAYKDAVRSIAPKGVPFDARVNIPTEQTPCSFRALAPQPAITLQAGQEAVYWVYIPDGNWTMRIIASTQKQAVVAVQSDNIPPASTVLQPGEHTSGEVPLGQQPDGWQQLHVRVANAQSDVVLQRFIFTGTGVGPSPFATGNDESGNQPPAVKGVGETAN